MDIHVAVQDRTDLATCKPNMSDKTDTFVEGTQPTGSPSSTFEDLKVRFERVVKPVGRDVNEILLFFAPNTLEDLRTPVIRTYIRPLRHNVLANIKYNVEGLVNCEKTDMCYGSPVQRSQAADTLLKAARNEGRRVAFKLPLIIVRSQIAFMAFTENVSALLTHFRQTTAITATTAVPTRAYAEVFKSFAEMHQLRLREGSTFGWDQKYKSQPDFVCTRNQRPFILAQVYNKGPNNMCNNNNNSRCPNRNAPAIKQEATVGTDRESHQCDNCGKRGTCCADLSYLTAQASLFRPEVDGEDNLDWAIKEDLSRQMVTALCRDDVSPYFSSPPRILALIVEDTRVRFARLKMDEDDVLCLVSGHKPAETPVIQYSRQYNMLNMADRQVLSPALLRLADVIGEPHPH